MNHDALRGVLYFPGFSSYSGVMDDPIAILTASRAAAEQEHPGRPGMWALILVMLALLAVSIAFFGKHDTTASMEPVVSQAPERAARAYTVSYRFGVFSPTNLRIHAGDTVRFRNDSQVAIRIVADVSAGQKMPEFDSVGQVQPGSYFSYTFPVTGVYAYHNDSESSESGVITVR